jgi:xanthine dehydrogenase accessory factor
MYEVISDIIRWLENGETVGLATVISTWGSAPRGVGAKLAFTSEGKLSGSVSGGCVEGAVIEAGLQVLNTGKAELLHFGVADETAFEVGLACGGNIEVFVKKLDPSKFDVLRKAMRAGQSVVDIMVIGELKEQVGSELVYLDQHIVAGSLGRELDGIASHLAQEAMDGEQSRSVPITLQDGNKARLFIDAIIPAPVLVMIGGVHIAITLAALAKALGYRTVVIDPRRAFGSPERFPNVDALIQEWPEQAFQKVDLTHDTCVALLTHDPKIDDPALKIVLESPAFYVGALGSRVTHQKRRKRLMAEGLTPEQLDRIHAPIGLDLGGKTPEETALAVMGEIVAVRNERNKWALLHN